MKKRVCGRLIHRVEMVDRNLGGFVISNPTRAIQDSRASISSKRNKKDGCDGVRDPLNQHT